MKKTSGILKKIDIKIAIAFFLIVSSNLCWVFPLVGMPLLPFSVKTKTVLATFSIVLGHVMYNLGLILVGERIVNRLKKKKINVHWFWNQLKIFIQALKHLLRYKRKAPKKWKKPKKAIQ